METKIVVLFLCDLLGVTGLGNGLINRVDSAKEAIIFVLAACYLAARLYFYVRRQNVLLKKEIFEQAEREKKSK